MERPDPREYPGYFQRYISLVPEGRIIEILFQLQQEMMQILNRFSEEVGAYRYAENKWSIKEIIGHIIDTERVFVYRALCFARDKDSHQPSFDQDTFAKNANYHQRSLLEISDEYRMVRDNSIVFFNSLDGEVTKNIGSASDYRMSLRTIPVILAGHEIHHRKVIEDKYIRKNLL